MWIQKDGKPDYKNKNIERKALWKYAAWQFLNGKNSVLELEKDRELKDREEKLKKRDRKTIL